MPTFLKVEGPETKCEKPKRVAMSNKRKVKRDRQKSRIRRKKLSVAEAGGGRGKQEGFSECTITTDPIELHKIPSEIEDEVEELFYDCQQDPGKAIPQLRALIEEYPAVPQLYNYLAVAYSAEGNEEMLREVAIWNYRNNPDYLFAKLNYAEVCLRDGNLEEIPDVFDNKFDLRELYPERDVFHLSEAVGFFGVVGSYLALSGRDEEARHYHRLMKKIAPGNPQTKRLGRMLSLKNRLMGIMDRVKSGLPGWNS
jgi:hypothetical protein